MGVGKIARMTIQISRRKSEVLIEFDSVHSQNRFELARESGTGMYE